MQFRTELKPQKSNVRITHHKRILSLGSCFAENIGHLLQENKFNILLNPFGITYNPAAIANGLDILRQNKSLSSDDLIEHNGIWASLDHHSQFSSPYPGLALNLINLEIEKGHKLLPKLDTLIITLGTAHVFYHKEKKRIVNNCHKLPSNQFERKLLSVNEIVTRLGNQLKGLKTMSPGLTIILTVSPVRHIRDGLVESKRSKATLLVAAHELASGFDFVQYYPAYEILLDDLRDYRFFNADLVHPSEEAIEYIWHHFSETFFGNETKEINKKVAKLKESMLHRPFFPDTDQHKAFLKAHLAKAKNLKKQYPFLNLDAEIAYFSS